MHEVLKMMHDDYVSNFVPHLAEGIQNLEKSIIQLTKAQKNLSSKHPDMSLQDTEIKVSKTLTQLLETDRGVTGGGMRSASLPFHQSTKMGPFCKAKAIMAGQIFLPIDLLYHFYLYSCNEKVVYAWLLVTQ